MTVPARLLSTLLLYAVLTTGCATDASRNRLSHSSTPPTSTAVIGQEPLLAATDRDAAPAIRDVASGASHSPQDADLVPVAYSDSLALGAEPDSPSISEPSAIAGAVGDAPPHEGWTLESLEQIALENNPSLRQASATVAEAAGIRTQVGLRPNPTVGYFGSQLGDDGTEQQGAFINQDFVLGGKLALSQNVINQDVQTLLWEVEVQRYRIRTDVRRRFYDALAAQRRVELASGFREVARHGVQVAEDRLRALEGARPDVLQSEIQLNEVDLMTQQAQIDFRAAWQELATVAGVPGMAPPVLIGSLKRPAETHEMETAYAELLGRSPELQAACTRVQRARANLARQQAQPIPNLQTQLQFGYDHATGSDLTNLQLGLPLPIHNKNQGNICAAQAEYARATHDVRRLELSLRNRLIQAMRDYDVARVTVDRYENQILPKTDENLKLSEEAHAAGEFDFLRVLVARRSYFDANVNYVQALAALAKADAVIDGLQLSGGLADPVDFTGDDGLRGQALGGQ